MTPPTLPTDDTRPLDAALSYMARRWPVVPACRATGPLDAKGRGPCNAPHHMSNGLCERPGKATTRKWRDRTATTAEEARTWWGSADLNVALLMGYGDGAVFALDVDTDVAKDGEASLAALVREYSPLPRTLEQATSRGRHLIFRFPPGFDVDAIKNNAGEIAPGLDVRARGGYILAAPSVHPSGAVYRWTDPDAPVAEAPPWLLKLLPRRAVSASPARASSNTQEPREGDLFAKTEARVLNDGATVDTDTGEVLRTAPAGHGGKPGSRGGTSDRTERRRKAQASLVERYRATLDKALSNDLATLASMPPDSGRNNFLNGTALRLMRLAIGGEVDLASVRDRCAAAALDAGLTPGEVSRTLNSAERAARKAGTPALSERAPVHATPEHQAERDRRGDEGTPTCELTPDGRPRINATPGAYDGGTLGACADRALAALVDARVEIYQRPGWGLARIVEAPTPERWDQDDWTQPDPGTPVVDDLPAVTLRELCDRAAQWVVTRRSKKGRLIEVATTPPVDVVATLHARAAWPGVRVLHGVTSCPVIRPDGTVLTAPGYDAATGLYLAWHGRPVEVPAHPTRDDARVALRVLHGVVDEFHFAGETQAQCAVNRAAWVALVCSILARPSFVGPVPAFLFNANRESAGKTMLADMAGILATGQSLPVRAYTDDDDEMAKRLASIARAAPPVILIDNVKAHLAGGAIETVLTSQGTIAARILGRTEDRSVPWRTVTILTGNGVTMSADVIRRTIRCELVGRGAFVGGEITYQIADPRAHVRQHRPALVAAACTLLRAWHCAGRPQEKVRGLDSFTAWCAAVAQPMVWAGSADPCEARPEKESDRDGQVSERFVHSALAVFGPRTFTVASMLAHLQNSTSGTTANAMELRAAVTDLCDVANLNGVKSKSLGKHLGAMVGRVVPLPDGGGVALVKDGSAHGSQVWRIARSVGAAATPSEGGFAGLGGFTRTGGSKSDFHGHGHETAMDATAAGKEYVRDVECQNVPTNPQTPPDPLPNTQVPATPPSTTGHPSLHHRMLDGNMVTPPMASAPSGCPSGSGSFVARIHLTATGFTVEAPGLASNDRPTLRELLRPLTPAAPLTLRVTPWIVEMDGPAGIRPLVHALAPDLVRACAPSLPPRAQWSPAMLATWREREALAFDGNADDPSAVADRELQILLARGEVS